jgi:fructose-1,6-bisphosphatase/sedoheptulose 1,7-bisphosphatase-like protein
MKDSQNRNCFADSSPRKRRIQSRIFAASGAHDKQINERAERNADGRQTQRINDLLAFSQSHTIRIIAAINKPRKRERLSV